MSLKKSKISESRIFKKRLEKKNKSRKDADKYFLCNCIKIKMKTKMLFLNDPETVFVRHSNP